MLYFQLDYSCFVQIKQEELIILKIKDDSVFLEYCCFVQTMQEKLILD